MPWPRAALSGGSSVGALAFPTGRAGPRRPAPALAGGRFARARSLGRRSLPARALLLAGQGRPAPCRGRSSRAGRRWTCGSGGRRRTRSWSGGKPSTAPSLAAAIHSAGSASSPWVAIVAAERVRRGLPIVWLRLGEQRCRMTGTGRRASSTRRRTRGSAPSGRGDGGRAGDLVACRVRHEHAGIAAAGRRAGDRHLPGGGAGRVGRQLGRDDRAEAVDRDGEYRLGVCERPAVEGGGMQRQLQRWSVTRTRTCSARRRGGRPAGRRRD